MPWLRLWKKPIALTTKTMTNDNKILALFLFVMCGVLTAFLMIALEREEKRMELQTQSWKDQGYPIGE